jgi:soluble lytic murein transglycosylase-like protein
MNKNKRIYLLLIFMLIFGYSSAYAGKYIDIKKIIRIESNGNANAYNKNSKARGLCQITPICLKEWNNFHKNKQYNLDNLWNSSINMEIAEWYLNIRIPQMLKVFKKEISTKNIIICYNAGIDYVVKNKTLKEETSDYIKKYNK